MSTSCRILIVNNIKLPLNASEQEAFSIAKNKLKKLGLYSIDQEFGIYKRSIDARNKNDIKIVYSIYANCGSLNINENRLNNTDVSIYNDVTEISVDNGSERLAAAPLIVGSGPCGLFSALLLAEKGYRPTVIERGSNISQRIKKVDDFINKRILDINTNIQFGAGGAGTFSDGKLITRINDPLCKFVLKKFVEFGAPAEILYQSRPHIGTDILSVVIDRMLSHIEALGGKVMYNTTLERIDVDKSVAYTSNGTIPYGALVLAIGHSARDTYFSLLKSEFSIIAKSFSVGMRIEHRANDIDRAMYGSFAGHKALGRAEYNLSYNTKERGVYTFCMCPGGEVVAAASEYDSVCVNGMSRQKRDLVNSNSAVVCSIFPEDYGNDPVSAINFQRRIEKAAFLAAGSDYCAPIITVGDFLSDKCISEPSYIMPSYMSANGSVRLASPSTYLPETVSSSIKNALVDFDKKISGFADPRAVLTGPETRTSSPLRILRDPSTNVALGFKNVYPSGEGAGYAGGITSAAVDGLKTAISIIKRYKTDSSDL